MNESLINYLHSLQKKYKNQKYIKTDPIFFVNQFQSTKQKELMGLIIALFSYGNIKSMFRFLEILYDSLKEDPIHKIQTHNIPSDLYYRFQSNKDIKIIFEVFKEIIIENINHDFLFKQLFYKQPIFSFYDIIDELRKNLFDRIPIRLRRDGIYHFFTISKESVCKRYCLFFRWMVRDDFPDFSIYKFLPKSELIYPIDVHIANFAFHHKIVFSKSINRKQAIQITDFFRKIYPEDPLIFDFYLTREPIVKKYFADL